MKNKINTKLFIMLSFISLTFTVLFAIQNATTGSTLLMMEQEERKLAEENVNLKQELMKHSSLTNAREKSEELGFSNSLQLMDLSEETTLAKGY